MEAKIVATEKNKRILARCYELAKQDYAGVSSEYEIIIGSFLESQDNTQSNSSENISISVEKET